MYYVYKHWKTFYQEKEGEQGSSKTRVSEPGSSHTRVAEKGSSKTRDEDQGSSLAKGGEEGDTGEDTSSSSSGTVRFKKLKLNHRKAGQNILSYF